MTPIYFLRLSKVWSILHHGSVGWLHKRMLLNALLYFFGVFLLFFIIKFVFLSCFYHAVPNFRNRILTNQNRELVVSNCQWPWTPRRLDSGLLDSRRLNSGRLDAWTQEILSIFSNILLLFNVEFLNISNALRLMHYGFVERAANVYYNSDLL